MIPVSSTLISTRYLIKVITLLYIDFFSPRKWTSRATPHYKYFVGKLGLVCLYTRLLDKFWKRAIQCHTNSGNSTKPNITFYEWMYGI